MFEDVARFAPIVVLAEYTESGERPQLKIVEVLRGETTTKTLAIGEHGLGDYKPIEGDRFLLALTVNRTLVETAPGMGACAARSLLAIRDGKLRRQDRTGWDGTRNPPALDQILESLRSER